MKNFIELGDQLTVPAPGGGVVSGQLVIIGSLIGVAGSNAAAGVNFACKTRGVFELPKVSAQAWTIGAPIYWDSGAANATTVSTANTAIGYATEAAANPSSVGRVRIAG
jgi:predicted RecA/RadA family phage recombinase